MPFPHKPLNLFLVKCYVCQGLDYKCFFLVFGLSVTNSICIFFVDRPDSALLCWVIGWVNLLSLKIDHILFIINEPDHALRVAIVVAVLVFQSFDSLIGDTVNVQVFIVILLVFDDYHSSCCIKLLVNFGFLLNFNGFCSICFLE